MNRLFRRLSRLFAPLCAGAGLLSAPLSSHALDARVSVGPSGTTLFVPAITNINVGDRVIWTWGSFGHTTTSDTGLWDSGFQSNPFSYTNQFNTPGSFPYHCEPHIAFNMRGTVNVAAPPSPPTTTITNPAHNVTLSAPASFILAATASDPGGSVTNVQFLQGTTSLGNDSSSPYSMNVSGLAPGDYSFSAIASDNTGLKATNTITVHVVTPVAIMLSAAERSSPTSFRFQYTANIGLRYVVQRSADLFNWIPLSTNTADASTVMFTDNDASGDPGYYRVGLLPNP